MHPNVHVAETVAWYWAVEWLHMHVLGDLATLAREARTGPQGDVSCCTLPHEPRKNETISGTYTWMRDVMNGTKHCRLKRIGNYWPENSSGDVTFQQVPLYVPRDDGEAMGRM